MNPAKSPRKRYEQVKVLVLNGQEPARIESLAMLAERFKSGDVLVVNRSGTIPASFRTRSSSGAEFELRLAAFQGPTLESPTDWAAVIFGKGTWRDPTENRGKCPLLKQGEELNLGGSLRARISHVDPLSPRLIQIQFSSPDFVADLYREGRMIQYSYLQEPLQVWDSQTDFAGAPISVEAPSAGFPIRMKWLMALRARGVQIVEILHSAGLSSTGDNLLDARLPLAEFSRVPEATARALNQARQDGRRIIALGTTAVRAVESAFDGREVQPGQRLATIKISAARPPQVIRHLITGMHEPGTSHFSLESGLAPLARLEAAWRLGEKEGLLSHEYGDLAWVG